MADFEAYQYARVQYSSQVLDVIASYLGSRLHRKRLIDENAWMKLWKNVWGIKRNHPELLSVPLEQFPAMIRYKQLDMLAELPIDLNGSGWVGLILWTGLDETRTTFPMI